MIPTIQRLFVILMTIAVIATALPTSLHASVFDPNYIISDTEMQYWQSMSEQDIQVFLEEKKSFLATYYSVNHDGEELRASKLIADAARAHRINPKYILVKLQKEQSLIMARNPTQKQLDWATGYGICDSCSMDDPTLDRFRGFGKQVNNAAGIIRWYYDNVDAQRWIRRPNVTYSISNTDVTPVNFATAFLYTYTPHIQGNRNFWVLWQSWFDQVYPDGTLIKTAGDPTVYVLIDGSKRAFTSMSALSTRYDPRLIVTVPASELLRYPDGAKISLPNYSIVTDGSIHYLIDYEYKRPFANRDVVRQLGYHPDEIIEVNTQELAGYTIGKMIDTGTTAPLGRLIEVRESGNLYYADDTVLHPIYDRAMLTVNFSHLSVERLTSAELQTLGYTFGTPVRMKDGTIFGIVGFNEIYVVEKGKKRHIASEEVFNSLGYSWTNIVWVNEYVGYGHETGTPMTTILSSPPPSLTPDSTTLTGN